MGTLRRVHHRRAVPLPLARERRRAARVAAVIAAVLVLTGCAGPEPAPPAATPPAPSDAAPDMTAAAMAAYGEFWRVSEAAFAAPRAQDWQAELSKVTRGQALDDVVLEIRNYASVPAHLEGQITHAPALDPAVPRTSGRVAVLDCVDISQSQLVADESGAVLDDQENQVVRYQYRAVVVRADDGRWLVESTAPALDESC
jgi:hypothetical protein